MASAFRRTTYQIICRKKLLLPHLYRENSTEANILKSVHKDIVTSHQTIRDFAWHNLDRWPDKTLTVCAVTGHGYTYAQTYRMSISFGASLRTKLNLQNDDKVAVILPNVPEYPCVVLGVLEAGCVASLMNPAYTPHELKHQLELIECKVIVSSKLSYSNIMQALKEMKLKIPIILLDNDVPENTIKFAEFAEDMNIDTDCLKKVKRSAKDLAILPFSSGTTGFPKAVELTHENLVHMNEMIFVPEAIGVEEASGSFQSVIPAVLPFYHIFGFNIVMINLMGKGAKLVTLATFKPDIFVEIIAKHKANHMYVVPPMVTFLGKHPAVTPEHLESLRGIICGAAPISSTDASFLLNKNKNIIFRQGYGLTETSGGISIANNTDREHHDSVGQVLAGGEMKIADLETQEALGPGREGEIWCRGKNVMKGYYKNDKATKETMTEDGWLKTGDIGKYDEEKFLYVTDRLKELIKVKGFQVPPAELEALLRSHPKIQDCAVVGIPDPISGEVPKAFVVQAGQDLKKEDVLDFINSKVVSFKKIKDVQFIDTIPKNTSGKILRKDLKAKYC
ncbi:unnamed protein product [Euphydryas editha]|uniref:Luciferin 4-monooxygenase n=1 Tax=Euphydryas editha TaxID=104508 RepID=A0AAU9TYF5_EUPED|nr:unnamed protein product [Euphydryas editha]